MPRQAHARIRPALVSILITLTTFSVSVSAATRVIYVDDDATGLNDGTSWVDAYKHLQDALSDANTSPKPVEVRVASGLYRPDLGAGLSAGDPNTVFNLLNGVTICGGYAGLGRPDPNAWDAQAHQTILSADLAANDVNNPSDPQYLASRADNNNNLIIGYLVDSTAILRGMTIITSGSNRAGALGAGVVVINAGSPKIMDCLFTGNGGMDRGVNICNDAAPEFTNCAFVEVGGGGARPVEVTGGSPIFDNCTFKNPSASLRIHGDSNVAVNSCVFEGHGFGAIFGFWQGTLTLNDCVLKDNAVGLRTTGGAVVTTNCTFENNGTAIDAMNASVTLTKCIFTGSKNGAVRVHADSDLRADGCVFRRNSTSSFGAGILITPSGELILTGCNFIENSASMGGAVYSLSHRTIVSNSIFEGNKTGSDGGAIFSSGGYTEIDKCVFVGNTAGHSGAALYSHGAPAVLNSIIRDNTTDVTAISGGNATVRFCNITGGSAGGGNIDVDPCFVQAGYWDPNGTPTDSNDDFWVQGDYHLKSQAGRWDSRIQGWVLDDVTSPCIDAGDTNSPIGFEPFPNGGRVNIGAYGGTTEASKSYFGSAPCEIVIAGDINGDCRVDQKDFAVLALHWLQCDTDLRNMPPTVTIIEPNDGQQIEWPGPTLFVARAHDADGTVKALMFKVQYKTDTHIEIRGFSAQKVEDRWQYQYTWTGDIPRGKWTVWAEARDDHGQLAQSPSIVIYLHDPGSVPNVP